MALTLRLSEKQLGELEEVKKALGRADMTSSAAIIMLITTHRRREEEREKMEKRIKELEAKEKLLDKISSTFAEIANINRNGET